MLADFPSLIAAGDVWTLSEIADIVGYIVMRATPDGWHVENVAVDPEAHGRGYGRRLLEFAGEEAKRRGCGMMNLYTNARMRENLPLYGRLGWREVDRRIEDGFERVYFEKPVSA